MLTHTGERPRSCQVCGIEIFALYKIFRIRWIWYHIKCTGHEAFHVTIISRGFAAKSHEHGLQKTSIIIIIITISLIEDSLRLTTSLLIVKVKRFSWYVLWPSSGGMFMSRFYLLCFIYSGSHVGLRSTLVWLIHFGDKRI